MRDTGNDPIPCILFGAAELSVIPPYSPKNVERLAVNRIYDWSNYLHMSRALLSARDYAILVAIAQNLIHRCRLLPPLRYYARPLTAKSFSLYTAVSTQGWGIPAKGRSRSYRQTSLACVALYHRARIDSISDMMDVFLFSYSA
jgi:hypothetical protein